MNNFTTRLGLDLGTNSIGWMLYSLADSGEISSVIGSGVRIFPEGRNEKSLASRNEDRRKARSIRRNLFRKVQRRNRLLLALAEFGLFPATTERRNGEIFPDYSSGKSLEKLNPWKLRADAVEKRLLPYHVGRALFHLNQRRGFKSNAKTDDERDSKVIGRAHEQMRKNMEENQRRLTVGQYLYRRLQDGLPVRARPIKISAGKVGEYEPLYPYRDDIAEEFDAIWAMQRAENDDFGKNKNGECGYEIIRKIIVEQRDLKRPIVGKCPFYPELDRASTALPSYQRFRIFNDLNHLEYRDEHGIHQLNAEERDEILRRLLCKERVSFDDMREILNNRAAVFNYERTVRKKRTKKSSLTSEREEKPRRTSISGDATSVKLRKVLSGHWKQLNTENAVESLANQDNFVQSLLDTNEQTVGSELASSFKVIAGLPKDRARFSSKAIRALIPYLEKGMLLDNAIDAAKSEGKIGERCSEGPGTLYEELPPYQDVARLRHLCLPRVPGDEDEPHNQRIPNPTVHIGLNQLRAVVNDIIRIYKIDTQLLQIALEMSRDLPVGAKGRKKIENEHLANRDNNERIVASLKSEYGPMSVTGRNIKKWKLWEELAQNPQDRKCVFCGEVEITPRELVTTNNEMAIEIEHILPFADTLDSGYMNLTLSCRACNHFKRKRDPYMAFGHDALLWSDIRKRASKLPHAKFRRFEIDALAKHKFDKDSFLPRQLPEIQWLSRAALHYLQAVCKDVYVVPGRLTGLLRAKWGLNSILSNSRDDDSGDNRDAKNREDHRHHAIDAAVIGATTRAILQKVATAANTGMDSENLFAEQVPFPTYGANNFRRMVKSAVDRIVVSHKPRRHKEGKLHNDTAYRIVKKDSDWVIVSHHIPIADLKEKSLYEDIKDDRLHDTWRRDDKIRDLTLRQRLIDWKKECQGDFKKAIEKARENGIRRAEVMKRTSAGSLIPIRHTGKGGGGGIKHYLPDSNWAYEIRRCSNGLWENSTVTTFDANRLRASDTATDLRPLIMRLHRGDMLILQHPQPNDVEKLGKGNGPIIVYVRQTTDNRVVLAEHNDARPDKRNNVDERDRLLYLKSGDDFRIRKARKIDVSPAGLMRKKPIPPMQ